MDETAALMALDALSQETRLSVFRLLVQAGPGGLPAGDVAEELGARQNTVSSHLKQLALAGLIVRQRHGRRIIYRAKYATVRELVLFLMHDCCAGNREVCKPVAETLATHCQV